MTNTESLPIVIISCQVFQHLLEKHIPDNGADCSITYLDYGLHLVPRNLKEAIQQKIDQIEQPSLVVLGYGLCGNGLDGIQSRNNTLLIPRTDDCIAILLGTYQRYKKEFSTNPATYYLSKGWLESASNPLIQFREYEEVYGNETATYLMDIQYKHYKRLVFVAHNLVDLEKYRPQAKEIARYCERWGMEYEEIIGSDDYIRRLMEVPFVMDRSGDDFLVIPPGAELKQSLFIR
jgi:hypothetical protein